MKIAVVHQFYLRAGQGGGPRFNAFTQVWRERGHEVTIIAGQVDYASGETFERDRHRAFSVEQGVYGERVVRVYTPPTYQRGRLGRALATGGFTLSAGAALAALAPHDVTIITSPPITLGALPAWARALGRAPIVFEVRDLWPESAVATGALRPRSTAWRALDAVAQSAYAMSDAVVALTPAIAEAVRRRELAARVEVIPNGADALMLAPPVSSKRRRALREALGWRAGQFVVLYAGAHGAANDLWQLLEAATLTRDDPTIVWAAVGAGPYKSELVAETARRGLTHLEWHEPVSRQRVRDYFDAADCGAAILKRAEAFKTVYPNKIFDAMSRARAVCCGVDGAARALVEDHGAGLYFKPQDAASFVATARALQADERARREMGARGRALVERRFRREALALDYLSVLEELTAERRK